MIRKSRRPLPLASDSSEDDSLRLQKELRTSASCNQNKTHLAATSRDCRQQHESDTSSNSSFVVSPIKSRRRLPISTSGESSSSENEGIRLPARRGCKRALSDYESGDSGDRVTTAALDNAIWDETGQYICGTTNSIQGRSSSMTSSSDESVVQISSIRLLHKRQLNPIFSTDSSDSGVPIGFRRSAKRMRLCSSSDESGSDDSIISSSRLVTESNETILGDRQSSNASRGRQPLTQQLSQEETNRNTVQGSSDRSMRRVTVQRRRLAREQAIQEQRMPAVQGAESSSESDDEPSLRNLPLILRGYSTSSSESRDSEESFLIQNPTRRGALVALRESDESSDNMANSVSVNTTPCKKSFNASSSDSDGESESCPICLVKIKLQEVGTPGTCGHCFCTLCIQEWAKNHNTCPVDRQPFNTILVRTHAAGEVIHEIQVGNPTVTKIEEDGWEVSINPEPREFVDYDSDGEGPDEVCYICGGRDDTDDMILCDFCNNVYHMSCVSPPLQYVPVISWYCPDCLEHEVV